MVSCSHDCASTSATTYAATSSAIGFVESIVNGAALSLTFATDLKFVAPVNDLPAGGGVAYGPLTDTRGTGANQTAGAAGNGLASVQARALWKDYILFRGKDTPFTCSIDIDTKPLARIVALEPLVSPRNATIQVKFWGYRGKQLITGAPFRG